MTELQKKWLTVGLIVVAVFLCLILVITVFFSIRELNARSIPLEEKEKAQVYQPVLSGQQLAYVYLPMVNKGDVIEHQLSDVYRVSQIDELALQRFGYVYDVATFVNIEDETVTLRAQCAQPNWPSPDIGTKYRLNQWGVLIPVVEDDNNPLQRFIVLVE